MTRLATKLNSFLTGFRTLLVAFAVQLEALLEPLFISGADIAWDRLCLATLFAILRLITTTPPGSKE